MDDERVSGTRCIKWILQVYGEEEGGEGMLWKRVYCSHSQRESDAKGINIDFASILARRKFRN